MHFRAGPSAVILTFFLFAAGAILIAGLSLAILPVFLIGLLLYPLLAVIPGRRLSVPDLADEILYADTEDGIRLALHHHRPLVPRPDALPVILCHGIATNKFGVDLDESHSIAVHLKRQGFHVFALGLRGTGLSSLPRGKRITFDDLVRLDAPAAIRTVLKTTGAPAISWVGYSLGGMIAYGLCGSDAKETRSVACAVALGSPGNAAHFRGRIVDLAARNPWIKRLIPMQPGSAMLSPLGGVLHTPIDRLLYDPKIVRPSTVRRLLRNAVEDIPQGMVDQLARWIREGRETSEDRSVDYRAAFGRINLPILFIAGAADCMAPPEQVRFAFRGVATRKKRFVLAGKEHGFKYDYCHIGLAMGETAPEEIFPLVDRWLKAHGMGPHKSKRTSPGQRHGKIAVSQGRKTYRGNRV